MVKSSQLPIARYWCTGILFVGLTSFNLLPALAGNPLSEIGRFINRFDNTINGVSNTIESINRLSDILGIQPSAADRDRHQQVTVLKQTTELYQTWYQSRSPAEQTVIADLVLTYAQTGVLDLNTISTREGFMQKSRQEQQAIAALLYQLNAIVKVVEADKDEFLAFAFCINNGNQSCSSQAIKRAL